MGRQYNRRQKKARTTARLKRQKKALKLKKAGQTQSVQPESAPVA